MHETPVEERADGQPVLGFHRATSHRVLDIEECPVLAPELERGIEDVRVALRELDKRDLPYQIEGACGSDGASWNPDLPGMRKDLVEHRVGRFRYLIEPESFFQGNRHLVDRLVDGAIAAATSRAAQRSKILLYEISLPCSCSKPPKMPSPPTVR